ncbi:MAG: PAS domain S-box protein [bacterium]|nr:PAS domain S-box protein [bacterium]
MNKLLFDLILILHLMLLIPLIDRIADVKKKRWQIVLGFVFSFIALATMRFSWKLAEGVVYDGRSIVLGFAGFYGGFIPLILTIFFATLYRIYIGGNGILAGILTIILCGFAGYVFRRFFYKKVIRWGFWKNLFVSIIFSYVLSFAMLFSQIFIFPFFSGFSKIKIIFFPLMTFYPLTTMISFLITNYVLKYNFTKRELEKRISLQKEIIDKANIIYVELDRGGNILDMNEESENVTGYKREEVLGKNWFETFIPDEYKKNVDEVFNDFKQFKIIRETYENPIKSKDGSLKYILWRNSIKRDGDKILGTISFGIDITEKKNLEKQILESEELFRKSFKEHNTVNLLVDSDTGEIVDFNDAALQFYGYTYDEMKKMNINQINILPDREIKNRMREARERKQNFFIFKYRLKDGRIRDVEVYSRGYDYKGKHFLHSIIFDVTEKLEYENRLKGTTEYLKHIFDSLTDALVIHDENYRIIDVNKKTCEMFGYSYEEVLNASINDLSYGKPPYSMEDAIKHLNEAKEKGETTFEWFSKRKDGTFFFSEVSIRFVEIMGFKRFIVLVRDISKRKELEKSLKESEERLKLALEGSEEIFWDLNIETGKIDYSERLNEILGYDENEIEKNIEQWKILLHPDDYESMIDTFNMYLSGRIDKYDVEYRLKKKDGDYVWFKSSGKIFEYNEHGKPSRMVGTLIDITSKKLLEEEIKRRKRFYRELFESAPDGVLILQNDVIIDCNKKSQEIFGLPKKFMVGKTPYDLSPEYQPDNILSKEKAKYWIKGVLEGENKIFNWIHKRDDGTNFECEISLTLLDKEQKIILAFVRDIDEKVKREKEIKNLQDQLYQSQKLETFGKFAGGIAHDFNNLLSVIMANAELSLEKVENDDLLKRNLETIVNVANDGAKLSKKLLIFGKEQVANPEVLNLNLFFKDIIPFLKKLIGENIEIFFYPEENLGNIIIDRIYLEQIFMNLAANARDAIEGNGKIIIQTKEVNLDDEYVKKHYGVDEDRYVMVSFSDTGKGIEKEIMSKIFDPFFTTKGEKGTGLGLSVVYGIVKQAKGYINVYSEKGVGTTFKIYFPLTDKKIETFKETKTDAKLKGSGNKILLVEDEEFLRNAVYEILTKNGYIVDIAKEGEEALEKFRNNFYDLVISDMIMPKMNGHLLYKELKSIRGNLKILFMSGYTDNAFKDNGIDLSNIPFILKPFRSFDLLKKVKELLG